MITKPTGLKSKRSWQNWVKNWTKKKEVKPLYYFSVIPSKQNIFFCLTKANGALLKNWTLRSFKLNRQKFKSKGQIKRVCKILRTYLKTLRGTFIFKCHVPTYKHIKLTRMISKRLSIKRILFCFSLPHNGCRLPKFKRK